MLYPILVAAEPTLVPVPVAPKPAPVYPFATGLAAEYVHQDPEINSNNIFGGHGADSLYRAALGWKDLAGDMAVAAESIEQVRAELRRQWSGPAATRMDQAAETFHQWLSELSARLEKIVNQIYQIESAFHAASNDSVRLAEIAANRAARSKMANENFYGQYTSNIECCDEEYEAFWRRDVEAMRNYHQGVCLVLAALPSLQTPPAANAQLTVKLQPGLRAHP